MPKGLGRIAARGSHASHFVRVQSFIESLSLSCRRLAFNPAIPFLEERSDAACRVVCKNLRVPIGGRHEGRKTTRHAASLRPPRHGRICLKPPYSKKGIAAKGPYRFNLYGRLAGCIKRKAVEGFSPYQRPTNPLPAPLHVRIWPPNSNMKRRR